MRIPSFHIEEKKILHEIIFLFSSRWMDLCVNEREKKVVKPNAHTHARFQKKLQKKFHWYFWVCFIRMSFVRLFVCCTLTFWPYIWHRVSMGLLWAHYLYFKHNTHIILDVSDGCVCARWSKSIWCVYVWALSMVFMRVSASVKNVLLFRLKLVYAIQMYRCLIFNILLVSTVTHI